MSATTSYTSHDYKPVTPVPVIASFDSDGHISPLYVRLEGVSYKIDTFWIKSSFANIIEFNCKVITTDEEVPDEQRRLIPLLLTYYQSECVWTIPEH